MFLRLWEVEAGENNVNFPISSSTLNGFKVTLGSTLELLNYLNNSLCYSFLMTSHLNQDPLEVKLYFDLLFEKLNHCIEKAY